MAKMSEDRQSDYSKGNAKDEKMIRSNSVL